MGHPRPRRRRVDSIPEGQPAIAGVNIRTLRQRKGWSQATLGELMGWQSASTVCAAEGRLDGRQRVRGPAGGSGRGEEGGGGRDAGPFAGGAKGPAFWALAAARPAKGGAADKLPRAALIVSRSELMVASTAEGS